MDRFSPPRRCDIRWHTEGGKSLLWGASSHYQVHICRSIHRRLLPYAPNNGSPMRYCRVSPYLSVRVTPFTITSDAALTNPLFLNMCSTFIRAGRINPQYRENGWNDKLALTLEYGAHDTQDVVKPHHSARGMHPIDVYISLFTSVLHSRAGLLSRVTRKYLGHRKLRSLATKTRCTMAVFPWHRSVPCVVVPDLSH